MTSHNDSNSNDSKQVKNQDDVLLDLQNKSSELVGGIKENEEKTTKTIDNLEGYIDATISDFKDDAEALFIYGKNVINNSRKSLARISIEARTELNSAFNYFRIFFIVTMVALILIGVLGGYLFHNFLIEYELEFFGIWGVLSLITLSVLWYFRGATSDTEFNMFASKEQEMLVEQANLRPNQKHDLSPLKRLTKAASIGIKGLTSNALELLPTASQLISHQNRRIKQDQFVKNFILALKRYNINCCDEAIEVMLTKTWVFDDEKRWLNDLSQEVGTIFKEIDPVVFRFFYYEFFDQKYSELLWKKLRQNERIRHQIAQQLLFGDLIKTPFGENSINIVSKLLEKMPQYSLEEAKNRTNYFFTNLLKFKESCLRHLEFYGINVIEKRCLFMNFIPESEEIDDWRDDVINNLSGIISKESQLVKLIVFTAEGDQQSPKIWHDFLGKGNLDDLAEILANTRIHPKFAGFDSTFPDLLKLAMNKTPNFFSLTDIEINLHEIQAEIIRVKYRVINTINQYKLKTIDSSLFGGYVPSLDGIIERELLTKVVTCLKIEPDLFSLLYSTANGLEDAQDIFTKIKDGPKIQKLGDFLIGNSFVDKTDFSINVVLVLKTQITFELGTFISTYSRYQRLFESLENFYPFLEKNGVMNNKNKLDFKDVIEIAPVSTISLADQLERIALKIVENNCEKIEKYDEYLVQIALASTALFMRIHGYTGYSKLCKKAVKKEFEVASKIIFHYTNIYAEQRLSGSKETLRNAIDRALKKTGDLHHYAFFKTELADGKLEPNAVFLGSRWKEVITNELSKIKNQGFEMDSLKNYVASIKGILNQNINTTIIKEFLITQVLSAYLFTVPGILPGIRFVSEEIEYIRKAENQLVEEKSDVTYRNLIQVSKGGGKATRIGLVPLELDFDEFSKKFNEVWERAVKLYQKEKNDNSRYPDPLPVYLTRIFPSDDGLKEITPSLDLKTKPLEIIRTLIENSMGNDEQISLLSLIQNVPNGKMALVNVFNAIFDSPKSNLYMLIQDQVEPLVIKSKPLLKLFESKKFESNLLKAYHAKKVSELSLKLAKRSDDAGEELALNEFRDNLRVPNERNLDLTSTELEIVERTLFTNLKTIGTLASI